ncbi:MULTISPECIES: FtsW/RodA/SpoVE family cell cycle protein [Hyphomicrobiales]|jgi:cell division protein FtsW|uniref:Probable peptidoglycan glycosyltransferase FtsW n=3 Tax=Prosthecodimorpha TaxID=2981530 RepID=A0A0P6VX72_9HYPH|nr:MULTISPECIES: putative peptidoglycan glycosyltransferase FtsW [Hyphomicrobiales]KPL51438.1 cell division protein FtsW [Prosthecomicrobium hirschii]MBT9291382.1 putative lipid II flippase FtsW [Prosthecodimorpha staleyi]MCW1838660.1 putative lipid II flippase FtsW [Prosthecomicrobium hirschii]
MVARTDRSSFAEWWWTIDRSLLAAFVALMVTGLVMSFAASPPVAERIGADQFHFVKRHAAFFLPALLVLFVGSFFTPRLVRRMALVTLIGGIALLAATLFFGQEIKGARRWLTIAGITVQPSEFVKPAFVIVVAWLFAERQRRPEIPGILFAVLLLIAMIGLLVAQPDFGQTMLTVIAWGSIFFVAGVPIFWVMVLGAAGVGGIYAAYTMLPHVTARINKFLAKFNGMEGAKANSTAFQADKALDSFASGGWLGRGPGEGTVKWILPDSHTDFIAAVMGEEFGILACLILASVIAYVVLRGLRHALATDDPFIRFSVTGLVTLFGVQSAINLAVNLHLVPSKGMTLPFISYGGSSLIAVALGMSWLLALTRRRAQTTRIARSIHDEQPLEALA